MTMPDPAFLDLFQRLAVAFGIGFLVGVERGWKHRDAADGSRAAGLRTHAIIGLLGGICGALVPYVGEGGFAALTVAFAAALILFKWRESQRDDDVSVTGTIAALLVFALGVYVMRGDLWIGAAAGVALAGVLTFKHGLHGWLDRLTWEELRSALLILAATAIALPLLPDRTVDVWRAINPRELWMLTILVASASFAGYVAVRLLGPEVGVLAGAAAGAVVSSTIVTAELGRRARSGETPTTLAAAGASLAAAVSMARTLFLAAIAAAPAWPHIAASITAAGLTFVAAALVLRRLGGGAKQAPVHPVESPLKVISVAQFALLLSVFVVVGRIVSEHFGERGLLPFAATAGVADIDAVTLAAGSLVRGGLAPTAAAHAILIGAFVNTFSKAAIGLVTGGWRYASLYAVAGVFATVAAAAAWFLVTPFILPMFG